MHTYPLVNNMAPPTVLVATSEEDKQEIAKLKANLEEKEQEAKKANHEKEDLEAKLKAADSYQEPGPVVKAIVAAMDDEHKEEAKARIAKLIANEDDPEKKAKLVKAMEKVFDTGNGENTNARTANDEEKEETAKTIAKLSAHYTKPLIAKILQAKAIAGASEESLVAEEKALSAMKLPEFEALYAQQEVFINQALLTQDNAIVESLSAKTIESTFEFNGAGLIGKTVNIDECREAINQ